MIIKYINAGSDVNNAQWVSVQFEFGKFSFSNFKVTEDSDFLSAAKNIQFKGNCGAVKRISKEEVHGGLDPDVALQESCISGQISGINNLSFQFDY